MRMAIQLSEENASQAIGGPFGAVVVKDGKLIAGSANRVTIDNDPTAHAEVAAIRLACKKLGSFDLSGCTIYASCEPCPMCLSAIYWARINTVYYANTKTDAKEIGFDDQFIYEEIVLQPEKRALKMIPFMRAEALGAFQTWQNSFDKRPY